MGKTSAKVKNRYATKAYDRINLQVKKGRKDEIKAAADAANESLNGYVTVAIDQRMERESLSKTPKPAPHE